MEDGGSSTIAKCLLSTSFYNSLIKIKSLKLQPDMQPLSSSMPLWQQWGVECVSGQSLTYYCRKTQNFYNFIHWLWLLSLPWVFWWTDGFTCCAWLANIVAILAVQPTFYYRTLPVLGDRSVGVSLSRTGASIDRISITKLHILRRRSSSCNMSLFWCWCANRNQRMILCLMMADVHNMKLCSQINAATLHPSGYTDI